MAFFKRRSFCVVTGASRGLGREIALQLAEGWSRQGVESDLVLLARTETDLHQTKSLIESSGRVGTAVHIVPADLKDLSALHTVFSECAKHADTSEKHCQFVLIHNAGSAGDLTRPMTQQTDPKDLQDQLALNFTSMSILTSLFLSKFTTGDRYVVNITSLLAKVFLPSFTMYSTTRAARNALMGVMAAENPDVRFLTYSPGPCMTDMFQSIPETSFSAKVQEIFRGQRERGEVLSCCESINKLMELLRKDDFDNAAIIDYYDK